MNIGHHSLLTLTALVFSVFLLPACATAEEQPVPAADTVGNMREPDLQVNNAIPDSIEMLLRSEQTALRRSVAATFFPLPTVILAIPGLIIGPSLGYFYGGLTTRAWTGIGLRLAGFGGMYGSLAIGWDSAPGDSDFTLAMWVLVPSAILLVGSAIYDIATVKQAVRHRNEELLGPNWSVTPVYSPESRTVGLMIAFAI